MINLLAGVDDDDDGEGYVGDRECDDNVDDGG